MKDPVVLNDFRAQWAEIAADTLAAVRTVGESGWYILGRQVAAFEQMLGQTLSVSQAIGCASGLDAIELGLRATGLQPGAKVLTTPLSAFATTLAIIRAGGVPVYVDVDASGLLDLGEMEAALRADPSIRHAVPVHLYGHALDLERLDRIRKEHDLIVIEDAAQAILARSRDISVGAVGQASALSFYPTKNLGALGDAGALLTSDDAVAARARCLRDYGQAAKYDHELLGMNSRLDELHAAILSQALLPRLSGGTARRCDIAARYLREIRHPHVAPLPVPEGSQSVWHLFPVRVAGAGRAMLVEHLSGLQIQSAVHYPTPIPDQRALAQVTWHAHGSLSNVRTLCQHALSLPVHPHMSDSHVTRVIEAVNSWAST